MADLLVEMYNEVKKKYGICFLGVWSLERERARITHVHYKCTHAYYVAQMAANREK